MIPLFGAEGEAALAALAQRPALYAFDFDGTLAPLVERPEWARMRHSIEALLAGLARHVPVAIVSGRSVGDLRQRVAIDVPYLIGNHGAEGLPSSSEGQSRERELSAGWLAQWPAAIARHGAARGIEVEDKSLSLSIHYRLAPDQDAAARAVEAAIAELRPAPHVVGGKCVFNLVAPGAPDKGQALQALVGIEGAEAAFFIGDDLTDESVFRAAPDDWVTVRVGVSDASAARFFIDDQERIGDCLERLIAHAGGDGASR